MGRFADLLGEIAANADGASGELVLPVESRDSLRESFSEEEIDDALVMVRESYFQDDLVQAADSLSARMVELLGAWGEAKAWRAAVEGHATLSIEVIRQLVHRVDRLEEALESFRDDRGPDRRGFDKLQRRLMDHGIEDEMRPDWETGEGPDESR
jgi:hypothetical protein